MAAHSSLPWVCLGDFNEVLRQDEHDGIGQRCQAQMQGFRDAVDVCGLIDLGFQGRKWTFEKKVAGCMFTRVRLDRALASDEWSSLFPTATVEHLTAATSDHSPILLKLEATAMNQKKEKLFRYEVMWDSHAEMKQAVRAAWDPNSHSPTASTVRAKLVSLAGSLGDWSKHTFGSVRGEIRSLKRELDRLRNDAARSGPCAAEIKINDRLIELYLREELMWSQRSRIGWLSAGDKNTHFFHLRASMRHRKNLIKSLQKPDGQLTDDPTEMQ